jgi:hypothetical protein
MPSARSADDIFCSSMPDWCEPSSWDLAQIASDEEVGAFTIAGRASWDPMAVLIAVRGAEGLYRLEPGHNTIDNSSGGNRWISSEGLTEDPFDDLPGSLPCDPGVNCRAGLSAFLGRHRLPAGLNEKGASAVANLSQTMVIRHGWSDAPQVYALLPDKHKLKVRADHTCGLQLW